jgi:hypothetical protein
VAQSVERRIGSAEVTGPIPVSSFFMKTGILNFRGSGFFFALQKGAKVFLKSFSLSYITSRNRIS